MRKKTLKVGDTIEMMGTKYKIVGLHKSLFGDYYVEYSTISDRGSTVIKTDTLNWVLGHITTYVQEVVI